jgi:hypothetical protein
MPGQKRKRDRVKIIDHLIKTEYPEHGPDYVAEKLGEDRKYIMTRAHYLKVSHKNKAERVKPRQRSRAELNERINTLESWNKELRLELIKMTNKKRGS